MELLNALGLNIKIFAAQLINFAVLFFVLYKFGYKPMLKFLDDRKDTIEKGVTDARKAKDKLIELEEKEKKVIKDAKKEALLIVEKAQKEGDDKREKMLARAKEEIGEIINVEKEKMRTEKAETLKEIKREIGSLIVQSLEQVMVEGIDEKRDKEIIKKLVKKIK